MVCFLTISSLLFDTDCVVVLVRMTRICTTDKLRKNGENFLAASLTRVVRAAVPIPAVAQASASVLHSAAFGGSVVGVVGPL